MFSPVLIRLIQFSICQNSSSLFNGKYISCYSVEPNNSV